MRSSLNQQTTSKTKTCSPVQCNALQSDGVHDGIQYNMSANTDTHANAKTMLHDIELDCSVFLCET